LQAFEFSNFMFIVYVRLYFLHNLFDQSYLSNFAEQTRYQVDLTLKQHQGGRFMVLDSLYFLSSSSSFSFKVN
jgi:hypothetical protein